MALIKHTDKPKDNFAMIPNSLIQGMGNLSFGAKNLFLFLYSQGPNYKPSLDSLCHLIYSKGERISRASMQRYIDELKKAHRLKVTRNGFETFDYHLYEHPFKDDEA